jgi:hypothetical protein
MSALMGHHPHKAAVPRGTEVVLDFVGATSALMLVASVSTGGLLSLAGLAGGHLKVTPGLGGSGIPFETKLVIPFWGREQILPK